MEDHREIDPEVAELIVKLREKLDLPGDCDILRFLRAIYNKINSIRVDKIAAAKSAFHSGFYRGTEQCGFRCFYIPPDEMAEMFKTFKKLHIAD